MKQLSLLCLLSLLVGCTAEPAADPTPDSPTPTTSITAKEVGYEDFLRTIEAFYRSPYFTDHLAAPASDDAWGFYDADHVGSLRAEDKLHRVTVTKAYAEVFSVMLYAYFTDETLTECVLVYPEISSTDLTLNPVATVAELGSGDVPVYFCRYRLAIPMDALSAEEYTALNTLVTDRAPRELMFTEENGRLVATDSLLYAGERE